MELEEKVFCFVSKVLRKKFYSLSDNSRVWGQPPGTKHSSPANTPGRSNSFDQSLSHLAKAFCFLCGKVDSMLPSSRTTCCNRRRRPFARAQSVVISEEGDRPGQAAEEPAEGLPEDAELPGAAPGEGPNAPGLGREGARREKGVFAAVDSEAGVRARSGQRWAAGASDSRRQDGRGAANDFGLHARTGRAHDAEHRLRQEKPNRVGQFAQLPAQGSQHGGSGPPLENVSFGAGAQGAAGKTQASIIG